MFSVSETRPFPSLIQHEENARGECFLCGGSTGRSDIHLSLDGETRSFCCKGCLYVYRILSEAPDGPPADFRKTELYRNALTAGVIQGGGGKEDMEDSHRPNVSDDLIRESHFRVEGMWCMSCALLIEEVLRKRAGIVEGKVFFFSDLVRIRYLPHRIALASAMDAVRDLGYRPSLPEDRDGAQSERRGLVLRLGVSSFLTMNIMAISFSLYFGFFHNLGQSAVSIFSYPLWILATAVLIFGGYPILRRGLAGLREGAPTMDTLISVGALSAYIYSAFRMLDGSLHLYFDTAAMLITLVLLGRFVENRARAEATRGVDELYHLARQKVRLIAGEKERWVTPEAVLPGDLIEVHTGETVSVDGRISSGKTSVDESFLTGEYRPSTRLEGEVVSAGSVVLGSSVQLLACSSGEKSTLKQMITLLEDSISAKGPVELLADQITRLAVPSVLVLSAATFLWLVFSGASLQEALLRATTVLVIACPCALGIATPLARVATLCAARRRGILIGRPDVIERSRGLGAVVFDKTGTVTEGRFTLRSIVPAEGETPEQVLSMAASVESHSDHYIALEILNKAREHSLRWEKSEGFAFIDGLGVSGSCHGLEVFVGNREWMRRRGALLPPWLGREAEHLESKGQTVVLTGWGGMVRGLLSLGDRLRPEAVKTVASFRRRGLEVWLVSGDSPETTAAVAKALGVQNFVGSALPAEKREIIRSLQRRGMKVAMIGDGINDASALAQADMGVAFGAKSGLLRQAGDMVVLNADLGKVLEAMALSSFSLRVVRENFFFSFFYNLVGIPLAVMGVLNPVFAVTAMFASSLTVIGNTLRITRKKLSATSDRQAENASVKSSPEGV
jgi:heavy metal translocating P-type ATPase